MDLCAAQPCEKAAYARTLDPRGLCRHHQGLLRKFGTLDVGYLEMFYSLVERRGDDECWLWTGAGNGADEPYGVYFTLKDAGFVDETYVHRIAYVLTHGHINPGAEIDHTCFVHMCVNAKHLRETTIKQNRENRKGADRDNVTGLRGVTQLGSGKYRALVRHNGRNIYLGHFATAEEAGEVARLKRLDLFTHNDVDRKVVD